jgi:hypothetical protein
MKNIQLKNIFLAIMMVLSTSVFAQNFDEISKEGLYYVTSNSEVKPLLSLNASGSKQSGTFKITIKMQFQGESADIKFTEKQPVFYFVQSPYSQTSARNYRLVKLEAKKGMRYFKWISASLAGASANNECIDFTTEQVEDNLYKIAPKEPLEVGHYAFYYNYGGAMPAIIYDFDIE